MKPLGFGRAYMGWFEWGEIRPSDILLRMDGGCEREVGAWCWVG